MGLFTLLCTSYLYGSTQVYQSPVGVAMSTNSAQSWQTLVSHEKTPVVELFPVTGEAGAVYALTMQSRTPLALGKAATLAAKAPQTAVTTTNVYAFDTEIASWVVAALAALGLLFALVRDLRSRHLSTDKNRATALVRIGR